MKHPLSTVDGGILKGIVYTALYLGLLKLLRWSKYRAKYWTVFAMLAQDIMDELYRCNHLERAYADIQIRLGRMYRGALR